MSEVLLFEIAQGLSHQTGADQQDQGESGLKDDQGLLRQQGAVACGAVHSAQGFGGIGV